LVFSVSPPPNPQRGNRPMFIVRGAKHTLENLVFSLLIGVCHMNPSAIEHAKIRIEKARKAIERLKNNPSPGETKDAWTDFLLAASAIYSKLEQGAKSSPKSEAWYGRMKKERKDDPLLQYIHHARNSDEHGLTAITKEVHRTMLKHPHINLTAELFADNPEAGEQDWQFIVAKPGAADEIVPAQKVGKKAGVGLADVTDDRYGDTFPVPNSHLGNEMKLDKPALAAEAAFEYLVMLTHSAEQLLQQVKPSK
ncbi:MAG: hypothetical protein AAFR88_12025, partial [Pseudomonadota bacterium]